jgi:polar amino acid transport system substrate-binding protein
MSNTRLLHEINSGTRLDAASNIFQASEVKAYLSDPIYRYKDVAITKKSAGLTINNMSDLKGKSIAAYQGAKELLGSEFNEVVSNNSFYSEHPHPRETTHLMVTDKKEVRIGDINIFLHDLSNKHYKEYPDLNIEYFKIHTIWPYVYSHIAFKNMAIRDSVNKVIAELKANGDIQKIFDKYQLK